MVQCAKMKQIQKFNISLRELDIFVSNYKTFQTFFFHHLCSVLCGCESAGSQEVLS